MSIYDPNTNTFDTAKAAIALLFLQLVARVHTLSQTVFTISAHIDTINGPMGMHRILTRLYSMNENCHVVPATSTMAQDLHITRLQAGLINIISQVKTSTTTAASQPPAKKTLLMHTANLNHSIRGNEFSI
ncbi:hypothetical protein HOY80DRAFT_1032604 [Tuber brumale]|nr:hypothetical protein HOY80DRAFT_1032604 [Tuber brumale]